MTEAKPQTRWQYGAELKQKILAECAQPGSIGGQRSSLEGH